MCLLLGDERSLKEEKRHYFLSMQHNSLPIPATNKKKSLLSGCPRHVAPYGYYSTRNITVEVKPFTLQTWSNFIYKLDA